MADAIGDIELAEMLAILAALGVGGYLVYKYLKSATCIASVGAIPGVTGATTAQASAANTAAKNIKPGGAVIWSCGSDFDYLQPCKGIVTEARHNFWDYIPIVNNFASGPVTYTDVPISCYCFCKPGINQGAVCLAENQYVAGG
jgi:hypothetical protein